MEKLVLLSEVYNAPTQIFEFKLSDSYEFQNHVQFSLTLISLYKLAQKILKTLANIRLSDFNDK